MRVLIGCERSGTVRDEFIKRGHDAWSCDLEPCDNDGPHIQGDVLQIINDGWDLGIFHPPCTFHANSRAQWLYHPDDKKLPKEERRRHPLYPNRLKDQRQGIIF